MAVLTLSAKAACCMRGNWIVVQAVANTRTAEAAIKRIEYLAGTICSGAQRNFFLERSDSASKFGSDFSVAPRIYDHGAAL